MTGVFIFIPAISTAKRSLLIRIPPLPGNRTIGAYLAPVVRYLSLERAPKADADAAAHAALHRYLAGDAILLSEPGHAAHHDARTAGGYGRNLFCSQYLGHEIDREAFLADRAIIRRDEYLFSIRLEEARPEYLALILAADEYERLHRTGPGEEYEWGDTDTAADEQCPALRYGKAVSERPLDTHDISRLHIGHLSCAPPNDAVYQYDVTGCAVRIGNTERAPQEIPALRGRTMTNWPGVTWRAISGTWMTMRLTTGVIVSLASTWPSCNNLSK